MAYTPYSVNQWQSLTKDSKVGYAYVSGLVNIALAAETDFCLFKNPVASGRLVQLYEQVISIPDSSNVVRSIIRAYKNPTITLNGTAMATGGLRNGQPASVLLAFNAPTIAARGTLVQIYGINYAPFVRTLDLARFIEQGDNLLITVQPSAATTNHSLTQSWAETP